MAGEWIKVEVSLDTKPEVFSIACELDRDPLHIVGMLWKVWAWADTHTLTGNAISVTTVTLDRLTNCQGFADALRKVGWLEGRDGLLSFPRFERHNGQTAKNRGLTAKRVAAHKSRKGNAQLTLGELPRVEEEKNKSIPTDLPTREKPVGDLESENAEWLENMRRNFPDRDVDGELKTFQRYCASKGTAANQRGFFGWLKKSSPAIPAQKSQWSY